MEKVKRRRGGGTFAWGRTLIWDLFCDFILFISWFIVFYYFLFIYLCVFIYFLFFFFFFEMIRISLLIKTSCVPNHCNNWNKSRKHVYRQIDLSPWLFAGRIYLQFIKRKYRTRKRKKKTITTTRIKNPLCWGHTKRGGLCWNGFDAKLRRVKHSSWTELQYIFFLFIYFWIYFSRPLLLLFLSLFFLSFFKTCKSGSFRADTPTRNPRQMSLPAKLLKL